jgi:hypothetical protein
MVLGFTPLAGAFMRWNSIQAGPRPSCRAHTTGQPTVGRIHHGETRGMLAVLSCCQQLSSDHSGKQWGRRMT